MQQALRKLKNRLRPTLSPSISSSVPVDSSIHSDRPLDKGLQQIIDRCRPFTMTSTERMIALHDAVRYVIANDIPGAFVECGVWRGGSAMVIIETLKQLGVTGRELWLYDTFEGMPPPTEVDRDLNGNAAERLMRESDRDSANVWAYCELDDVKANIDRLGSSTNDIVRFVKGKVEETIPDSIPDKIALLRLDTDWYESTRHELIHLFPRLETGGILLIDDYGHWQGAQKATDQYIAENQLRIFLQRIDYTGRIAVKQE